MPSVKQADLESVYCVQKIDLEILRRYIVNKDNLERLYRLYNGLISATVLYQYFTTPEATFEEYVPDALLHSFEAFMPGGWNPFVAVSFNGARAVQASWAALTGISSIPRLANCVDVGNHLLIMYHRARSNDEKKSPSDNPSQANADAKPKLI